MNFTAADIVDMCISCVMFHIKASRLSGASQNQPAQSARSIHMDTWQVVGGIVHELIFMTACIYPHVKVRSLALTAVASQRQRACAEAAGLALPAVASWPQPADPRLQSAVVVSCHAQLAIVEGAQHQPCMPPSPDCLVLQVWQKAHDYCTQSAHHQNSNRIGAQP